MIPCQYRRKWYITKNVIFGLHFCCIKYPCIFNHSYAIRQESYRIQWNYAAVRLISRSFKVIEFGTNRKPICDFLLVINSRPNLPPIPCTVSEIASQKVQNRYIFNTLWFNPPTEGFPWDDLHKILPGCVQVTNVLNGAETLPKISIAWVGCTNVTDKRQTDDRRTDDDI